MKLDFLAAHPKVGAMRKRYGFEDGSSRSYPNAGKITTYREEMDVEKDGLPVYRDLLLKHATAGRALFKGLFKNPLNNESRRGQAAKGEKTDFLVIDIDGVPLDGLKTTGCDKETVRVVAERILNMLPERLRTTSYVAVASSSFGIKDNEVSVHLHFLLKNPVQHRLMKKWLTSLNFTRQEIYERLGLTDSKLNVKYIVDPCLGEDSRIVYIAPPEFITDKVVNPFNDDRDRIIYVKKDTELLDFDAELETLANKSEIVANRTKEVKAELQKKAGVDPRKIKTKRLKLDGREVSVVTNPPEMTLDFAYEEYNGQYVRYNTSGKRSNKYYVRIDNPEILLSFSSSETPLLFRAADPEAYAMHVEKYGGGYQTTKKTDTGKEIRVERAIYIDQVTDTFATVEYDRQNDELVECLPGRGKLTAEQWLRHYGLFVPDPVPPIYIHNDPHEDRTLYEKGDKLYLNRFTPPKALVTKPEMDPIDADALRYGTAWTMHFDTPVICEVMLNMLGDCMESFEHFVNWLAFVVQNRDKAETAFLLGGEEGTGKGLFFKAVLRPLFGQYCMQNTLQGIADDNFNSWMEDLFLVMVDEFDMKGASSSVKSIGAKLKNYITEPTLPMRAMQQAQREVRQYLNFIFTTNELDSLQINDKRRFNIPPRQLRNLEQRLETLKSHREGWDKQIAEELPTFFAQLHNFTVNRGQVNTILDSSARKSVIEAGMNSQDRFFQAITQGDMGFFIGILDRSNRNLTPEEQIKLTYVRNLITASLEYVNTGQPCYYHKEDLCELYSYMANRPTSINAFGRMMSGHDVPTKRRNLPVGHKTKLPTRPDCVEVTWHFNDVDTLKEVLAANVRSTKTTPIKTEKAAEPEAQQPESDEQRKQRIKEEALKWQ